MSTHVKPTKDEIVGLEKSYWDAIKEKDGTRTAELSGKTSLVTGPQGVMNIPKSKMEKITEDWKMDTGVLCL